MINETLNNSIGLGGITYDNAVAITSSMPFIVIYIFLALFTLIIFMSWGCLARAKTSDGRILSKTHAIRTPNFWISWVLLWLLPNALFWITFIYPVWLIPFS
jgi:hypothetical protein